MEFSDVWKIKKIAEESCYACGGSGKCYACHSKVQEARLRDTGEERTRAEDSVKCDSCYGSRRCSVCHPILP